MKVSYVIVSYNRRVALLGTLRHLHSARVDHGGPWEVIVVDNASTDGTQSAVQAEFPGIRYILRPTNEGVGARSAGFGPARGEYIVLLDDDSAPIGDAVARSVSYLDQNPTCGAIVGKVLLPDGGEEGCALPGVMISCAVCIRKSVIDRVGGFRREFFRKGGEYDFSYRIWQAGYSIVRFDDIIYRHDKVLTGRSKAFAHRMDLRNNLILVERFMPRSLRAAYRADVTQRYSALARFEGFGLAAACARIEALVWRFREMVTGRQTLSPAVVEELFELAKQSRQVQAFASQHQLSRVAIADFSKNLYATWRACLNAGLEVVAIWDDHPAYAGLKYRGVPVLPRGSQADQIQAVIVSNINPAQSRVKAAKVREQFTGPILELWEPTFSSPRQLREAA